MIESEYQAKLTCLLARINDLEVALDGELSRGELRMELLGLRRRVDKTVLFLAKVGSKDPRSSGFIAQRAIDRLRGL